MTFYLKRTCRFFFLSAIAINKSLKMSKEAIFAHHSCLFLPEIWHHNIVLCFVSFLVTLRNFHCLFFLLEIRLEFSKNFIRCLRISFLNSSWILPETYPRLNLKFGEYGVETFILFFSWNISSVQEFVRSQY